MNALQFNGNIHSRRHVKSCERVDRFRCRFQYVDEPIVSPQLEMLPRVFVNMRATYHAEALNSGWQRHGSRNACARALCSLNDLPRGLIKQPVVESFQYDAYLLAVGCNHIALLPTPSSIMRLHLLFCQYYNVAVEIISPLRPQEQARSCRTPSYSLHVPASESELR